MLGLDMTLKDVDGGRTRTGVGLICSLELRLTVVLGYGVVNGGGEAVLIIGSVDIRFGLETTLKPLFDDRFDCAASCCPMLGEVSLDPAKSPGLCIVSELAAFGVSDF